MPRTLGLAISATAVRGVVLKTSFKSMALERVLEVRLADIDVAEAVSTDAPAAPLAAGGLPHDTSGETEPSPPDAGATATTAQSLEARRLHKALRLLSTRLGPAPDRVVACLPGQDASLRVLSIPAGARKRIREVLPFELESLLPFALEDALVDYQLLEKSATELSLLACAAPKERIRQFLAPLHRASLFPKELAVGAAALEGLVHLCPDLSATQHAVLLLELAEDGTDLCLLRNGKPVFVRSLSTGIAALDDLPAELSRSLAAARAKFSVVPSEAVLLGDRADDPALLDWLSQTLSLPVRLLSLPAPTEHATPITLTGTPETESLAQFGRAAALAARTRSLGHRINLLQGEFALVRSMGALRGYVPLFVASAAVVVLSFLLAVWSEWILLRDTKTVLEDQLAAVTQAAFGRTVKSADRARKLLTGAGRRQDPLPPFDAYDLVDILTAVIPSDMTHDAQRLTFTLEEDGRSARFDLKGTVSSIANIDTLKSALTNYECAFCDGDARRCFETVENKGATVGAGNVGQGYELEGIMRCPADRRPEP